MSDALDYSAAGAKIRTDLKRSHRRALDYVARPGSWWSGAERIALAQEARSAAGCSLCRERKAALSPEHAQGRHGGPSPLPEAVVDLVHRVRSDPGRMSRRVYEQALAAGVSEGHYVEAVGIAALVAGLDFECRALGIAPFPFPEPVAGEPSGYRPEGLTPGIAWVPMLLPEDAAGPEKGLYGGLPMVPNIMRALSSVPDHVRALLDWMGSHYVSVSDLSEERAIDRLQIELVASRVSALNECFY